MNKYVRIFRDFLQVDKQYVKKLLPHYFDEICTIGQYLEKKADVFHCVSTNDMCELVEFMDGNGFIVEPCKSMWSSIDYYKVMPIYAETIEIIGIDEEEENEEEESAISMDPFVSTEILYNASMEADQRSLLEYEELFTPRLYWLSYDRKYHKKVYIKLYTKRDIHPP